MSIDYDAPRMSQVDDVREPLDELKPEKGASNAAVSSTTRKPSNPSGALMIFTVRFSPLLPIILRNRVMPSVQWLPPLPPQRTSP